MTDIEWKELDGEPMECRCYAVRDTPPPKDGTRVLIFIRPHGWVTAVWELSATGTEIWCVDDFKHGPYAIRGYTRDEVTHWMTLPESPSNTN